MDKNEILQMSREENLHGDERERMIKGQRLQRYSVILNGIFVVGIAFLLLDGTAGFRSVYESVFTVAYVLYGCWGFCNFLYEYVMMDRHPLYLFLSMMHLCLLLPCFLSLLMQSI